MKKMPRLTLVALITSFGFTAVLLARPVSAEAPILAKSQISTYQLEQPLSFSQLGGIPKLNKKPAVVANGESSVKPQKPESVKTKGESNAF